jgi:hypothetical protein
MDTHENALLTPKGREAMVRSVPFPIQSNRKRL